MNVNKVTNGSANDNGVAGALAYHGVDDEAASALIDILRDVRVRGRAAGWSLGLTRAQQGALQVLSRHDGIDMKRLAQRLEVSQPSVTATVDSLVKAGLARRKRDRADARVVRIELTDTAKDVAATIKKIQMVEMSQLLSPLSTREKETLTRLLKKMSADGVEVAAPRGKTTARVHSKARKTR